MARRLTPRTLAVRLALFCGVLLVGCRGCDSSSSSSSSSKSEPITIDCSADFSRPDPVLTCPATFDEVPTFCDDPDLVCNYDQELNSRIRCACEGGRWKCIEFEADMGVSIDLAEPAPPSDDLGENDLGQED